MYNLHCHTILSDGDLVASEVAVRFAAAGYKVIAITDHCDYSNIKSSVAAIREFTRHWPKDSSIRVLCGVELTHIPPEQFKPLAKLARASGAQVIVGHGQTVSEPVIPGTNHAALASDIDILAHPGMISDEDVLLAKKRGIFLELTARRGHNTTNHHVAARAVALGAKLCLNLDSHSPEDIITPEALQEVGFAAGLSAARVGQIFSDEEAFVKSLL